MDEEAVESDQAKAHGRLVPGGQGWRYTVRGCKIGMGNSRDKGRWLYKHPEGKSMRLAIGLENLGETAWWS